MFRTVSDEQSTVKRPIILFILLIVAICTVIVIFTRVGRAVANDDPLLNPKANPNIHLASDQS